MFGVGVSGLAEVIDVAVGPEAARLRSGAGQSPGHAVAADADADLSGLYLSQTHQK